ncbi:MAG: Smr/MutS family protein [Escherichia sp.]
MEDVQPLKRNNDVHWHPERKTRAVQRVDTLQLDNFLTTGYLDIVPLATALEFKREGLQSGVLEKLRRGKYGQQASLNLLRQPVEKCRQMLFAFVVQAQKEGLRNLLIVHGKGRDDNAHANIIRSYGALAGGATGSPGVLRSATAPRQQHPRLRRYESPEANWRTGAHAIQP